MAIQIIIVEDSADDVALLRRAFQVVDRECQIRVFPAAALAMGYFGSLEHSGMTSPDLVVLDLQLPDGTGNHLVKRLREELPRLSAMPVAVVSNHEPLLRELDHERIQGCFEKPFRYEQWKELAQKLRQLANPLSEAPSAGL